MGGIAGLLLAIGGIESTYQNAPLIEMNFQFQKGSGDYLSQKLVTYEFVNGTSANSSRVVYSTDNGEGSTDGEGRFKLIVSTVGTMKFKILEPLDRSPLGSFTTTILPELKKEDVKMENVEGNLGIQVLSINNSYNTYVTQEVVSNIVAPSELTYSSSTIIGVRNTALPSFQPNYKGTSPIAFSVAPSLPLGMSISSSTGIISGTPLAITPVATYTITAKNTKGSTTTALSIRVNDSPPANFLYLSNGTALSSNTLILTRNTSVVNLTPSVSGNVTGYTVSPSLPIGLTINTSTGAISGTPSAVTATGIYSITVFNTGGSATLNFNITVNDAPPSSLSYGASTFSMIRERSYSFSPTYTGQNVTFSISPSNLPTGLSFNSSTGVFSGIPTNDTANTSYTVTASNTGGSLFVSLQIGVSTLSCAAGQYFTGGYCVNVGKGFYSTGDNIRRACTTSATMANMDYVRDNSTVPDCEVACADNYYLNNGTCVYSQGAKALTCNQGYYATGIYGAAGGIFDSFGLRCGVISSGSTSSIYNGAKNSYGTGGDAFVADCGNGQAIARIYSAIGVSFGGQYPLMSQFSLYCKNVSTSVDGSAYGPYGSTGGTMVNLVCPSGQYVYGVVSRLASGCTDFTNCGGVPFTGFAKEIIGILCK
jgi:uncharacterized repeat protein (TIGR01451 family)